MPLRSFSQLKRISKTRDYCFVFGFLAVISLFCFATFWRWQRHAPRPSELNKSAAANESHVIKTPLQSAVGGLRFARQFVHDFDEWVTMRDTLIRWNSIVKVKYLKIPSSSYVVLGKQNWMFTDDHGSLENFRGLKPLPASEVAHLKNVFERHNRQLAQQGIKFLMVIAPDKESVYPEYMPDKYRPAANRKHLDQFMAVMKGSPVSILDLRPALRHAKADFDLVYIRDDTHWNDQGAFVAYQATAARLKQFYPALHPIPFNELRKESFVRKSADMPELMSLDRFAEKETSLRPRLSQEFFRSEESEIQNPNFRMKVVTRHSKGEIKRVLVFGDSISVNTRYLDFLAQHFQDAHWYWLKDHTRLDYKIIREFKPDLVILERIERLAFTLPPEDKKPVEEQKEKP